MRQELKKAVDWFKGLVSQSRRTGKSRIKTLRGKLIFMIYDPKTKEKLPYYDTYPLIFVLETGSNYIYGINLHYLDQRYRKTLVNALYNFGLEDTDEEAILKFRYADLQGFIKEPHVRVCFKMYYTKNIQNWMLVPSDQWNNMIMLPLQNFQKQSATHVWKESLDKIRGN